MSDTKAAVIPIKGRSKQKYRGKWIRTIPDNEKGAGFDYTHVVLVGPGVLVHSIEEARKTIDNHFDGTLPQTA